MDLFAFKYGKDVDGGAMSFSISQALANANPFRDAVGGYPHRSARAATFVHGRLVKIHSGIRRRLHV
jgi:hypothetical protein